MLITREYDDREKKLVTLVAVRTVNEFTNFHYEIIVQPTVDEHTLRFDIRGLRAPQVSIPGMGPAIWSSRFGNLNGRFDVVISKLDREENSYGVRITEREVIVESGPEKRFIDLVTRKEEW